MPRDTLTSFVVCALLFGCGPHMSSAPTDAEHAHVEKIICADMPMACLCQARTLRVSTHAGKAMQCGEAQVRGDLINPPTILPPAGVAIDSVRRIHSEVGNIKQSHETVSLQLEFFKIT